MLSTAQSLLSHAAQLTLTPVVALEGGDISSVAKMGPWVLKTPKNGQPVQMCLSEANGLGRLATSGCRTPHIHFANELGLVLEFYAPSTSSDIHYAEFGAELARLHLRKYAHYGDDAEVFLAALTLPKISAQMNWNQAFVQCRLDVMYRRALAQDPKLRSINLHTLNGVTLPHEGPCLIHGDLWRGNILSTHNGLLMIDPSCWIGERTIDIAMLQLFGDMPKVFWQAYFALYPLPSEIKRVIPLYQLYYALTHVALFGKRYTTLCLQLWQDHLGQNI